MKNHPALIMMKSAQVILPFSHLSPFHPGLQTQLPLAGSQNTEFAFMQSHGWVQLNPNLKASLLQPQISIQQ